MRAPNSINASAYASNGFAQKKTLFGNSSTRSAPQNVDVGDDGFPVKSQSITEL